MSACQYKSGPYRSRRGMIFGVCRGLAEHLNVSVGWTRFFTVLGFILTGFWPVGAAYIIAALLMKPEPVLAFRSEEDAEFYGSYASSREMARRRLRRTFDSLDRRLQRLESVVTDRSFDWDRRINEQ
ncbi:MAG: PspC domain-containing protein [Candidatus Hydrogenedentes bacterium]|nr:PspC domain-containing protein [Candidatus Hydrogenedentota bacterium]MBI3117218.1 PspC domain-containing protein [Candidatus Hydrogenedentota bacterium]